MDLLAQAVRHIFEEQVLGNGSTKKVVGAPDIGAPGDIPLGCEEDDRNAPSNDARIARLGSPRPIALPVCKQ